VLTYSYEVSLERRKKKEKKKKRTLFMVYSVTRIIVSLCFEVHDRLHKISTTSPSMSPHDIWHSSALF
jgi:hypothetical protein